MGALGESGDAPVMARGGQGDHTTSLNILAATLAGLRLRDQTGEAQRVEVTLQLTGMWTIGTDLQNALQSAAQPAKVDRRSPWNALANSYPTRDGRWLLLMMPQAERYWPRLCEAIREPGWAGDERYDSITKLLARGRSWPRRWSSGSWARTSKPGEPASTRPAASGRRSRSSPR